MGDPMAGRTANAWMRNGVAARRRFAADASGATAIEYAMIAGLIFVVIAGSLRLYSTKVGDVYTRIGNTITLAD